MQGDNPMSAPQFKTWLYVYRNNSINEEFRRTLSEDYFVDVKEIDRLELNEWSDEPSNSDSNSVNLNQPQADVPFTDPENSKDVPEFVTLNLVQEDETRLIDDGQSDASKFDEVVEDKQYVEVPVIKEEIAQQAKEKEQKAKEQANQTNVEVELKLREQKEKEEDIVQQTKDKEQKAKEQISTSFVEMELNEKEQTRPKESVPLKETARLRVPVKGFDNFEIMEGQESHFDAREVITFQDFLKYIFK